MALLTLDVDGIVSAIVIALVLIYLGAITPQGSYLGAFYLFVMIYFLALSAIVTRVGESRKKRGKLYQETRGIKNVLANGMGPLVFAVLGMLLYNTGAFSGIANGFYYAYVIGFIASVAAVTADKFSSEIGVLNGRPTSIVTFKKIEKGKSGGISPLGTSAGLLGAFLIAAIAGYGAVVLFQGTPTQVCSGSCITVSTTSANALGGLLEVIIAVTVAGFVGTLVDSLLGYFEEKGTGNKYTTNFLCSIAGGAVGFLLFYAFAAV